MAANENEPAVADEAAQQDERGADDAQQPAGVDGEAARAAEAARRHAAMDALPPKPINWPVSYDNVLAAFRQLERQDGPRFAYTATQVCKHLRMHCDHLEGARVPDIRPKVLRHLRFGTHNRRDFKNAVTYDRYMLRVPGA